MEIVMDGVVKVLKELSTFISWWQYCEIHSTF